MKKKSFLIALFILVTVFNITPLMAQACEPVEVDKWLRCQYTPGKGTDDPPYYVGTKYIFWIVYKVTANEALSDVVVYDRFGAELMIEGITVLGTSAELDAYDYSVHGHQPSRHARIHFMRNIRIEFWSNSESPP
jgi:hypothetical protein